MVVHSKPTITVFADASAFPDGRAGWGGWARGDDRAPVFHSGPAPFNRSSGVVELWALALHVENLINTGYVIRADRSLILQSDSLYALGALNAVVPNSYASSRKQGDSLIMRAKTVAPNALEPAKRVAAALAHADVVYLRHVKGHAGGAHARSWVNEQCDRLAKAAAKQLTSTAGW